MMPFLIDRRDQVLIKRIERPLKKGDIAFFQRENGQYIMHRIHFMRKDDRTGENQFYFIGDGQKNIEGPIKEIQIFGKFFIFFIKNFNILNKSSSIINMS